MSLLHSLPAEICLALSLSWLDLIDLAHLDSAMCVHEERATFLSTSFAGNCVYDYSQYFDKEKTKKEAIFCKPEFLEWILLRGVRLSFLASFFGFKTNLAHAKRAFKDIIRTSGTCLKTVQTDMDYDVIKATLCAHCTALERLECGMVCKKEGLDTLLNACPSLQHLTFKGTDGPALEALQEFGTQIRTLRMTDATICKQRPQWAHLVPHLPNLTDLEMGQNFPVDAVLTAVGQHCFHLRALKMISYVLTRPDTSAVAMQAVIHGCPNLECLHVGGVLSFDNETWRNLLHCCRKLTTLRLGNFVDTPYDFLLVLARDFPALRELHLGSRYKSSGLPQLVTSWPLLESLFATHETVTDELMYALGTHCPRLRCLAVRQSQLVPDAGVTALAKGCAQLQRLELKNCDSITVAALEAIVTHCRYLKRLHIQQYNAANWIIQEQAEPYLQLKLGNINSYTLA